MMPKPVTKMNQIFYPFLAPLKLKPDLNLPFQGISTTTPTNFDHLLGHFTESFDL